MTKRFKKKTEDFNCEKCNFFVVGNGYTNHCPKCLFSKHVDNNPGDREAVCGGLMKPILVEGTQKEYIITHACAICGHKKRNKASNEDSIDELVKVIKTAHDKL